MNTEIICVLISLAGTIMSALISWMVAKTSAQKEIKMLTMTWAREDVVSSDDEIATMVRYVSEFIVNNNDTNQSKALAEVGAVRAKESGALGDNLDQLYSAVLKRDSKTRDLLTEVIKEKRKAKRAECSQE